MLGDRLGLHWDARWVCGGGCHPRELLGGGGWWVPGRKGKGPPAQGWGLWPHLLPTPALPSGGRSDRAASPPWLLSPEPLPPPYRLQQVAVQVVENGVCDQLYHNASEHHQLGKIIQDDMLCAGTEGRDSCYVSPTPTLPSPCCGGGGVGPLSPPSPPAGGLRGAPGLQAEAHLVLGGRGQLGLRLWPAQHPRGLRSRPDLRAVDHAADPERPLTRPGAAAPASSWHLLLQPWPPGPGLGPTFSSALLRVHSFPDSRRMEQGDAGERGERPLR